MRYKWLIFFLLYSINSLSCKVLWVYCEAAGKKWTISFQLRWVPGFTADACSSASQGQTYQAETQISTRTTAAVIQIRDDGPLDPWWATWGMRSRSGTRHQCYYFKSQQKVLIKKIYICAFFLVQCLSMWCTGSHSLPPPFKQLIQCQRRHFSDTIVCPVCWWRVSSTLWRRDKWLPALKKTPKYCHGNSSYVLPCSVVSAFSQHSRSETRSCDQNTDTLE